MRKPSFAIQRPRAQPRESTSGPSRSAFPPFLIFFFFFFSFCLLGYAFRRNITDPPTNKTTLSPPSSPLRTYTLYIAYTPYYRTPRLYLSGYLSPSQPLPPALMMEDIVGDYKEKTVTLEDYPFFDSPVKMASVHPCRHASVMKVLLDRADAALKLRLEKIKRGQRVNKAGMEGLVDEMEGLGMGRGVGEIRGGNAAAANANASAKESGTKGVQAAGGSGSGSGSGGDEWEVLQHEGTEEEKDDGDEVAIRVDQYLVVFLKFISSVTPGIEHDFTMGV